jgi:hypothetical protein
MSLNTDRLEDFVSQFEKNAVGYTLVRGTSFIQLLPDIPTP